jgi:hypothetical protein
LVAQGPAIAQDHCIPQTVLMKGKEELQTGREVAESYSTYRVGGEYVSQHALFSWGFPEVGHVAAGSKLRVRIHKVQKPRPFYIADVDESGTVQREERVRLKPVVRDERTVAWDAVFRVNRPDCHYYLAIEGHWKTGKVLVRTSSVVIPAMFVNLTYSAEEVGGAIMPQGWS